jgi:hypothetical protein
MLLEFTLYTVIGNYIRPHSLGHTTVWVGFSDRTHKAIFMHEPADLLVINSDTHMQKPHVYASHTFVVSAEFEGFQDQLKIFVIPSSSFSSLSTAA